MTCGLLSSVSASQVIGWGYDYAGAGGIVFPDFNDVAQVSGGAEITIGLRSDGSLIGRSVYGNNPLTLQAGLSNIVALSVSPLRGGRVGFSLALRGDGTVASLHSDGLGIRHRIRGNKCA